MSADIVTSRRGLFGWLAAGAAVLAAPKVLLVDPEPVVVAETIPVTGAVISRTVYPGDVLWPGVREWWYRQYENDLLRAQSYDDLFRDA